MTTWRVGRRVLQVLLILIFFGLPCLAEPGVEIPLETRPEAEGVINGWILLDGNLERAREAIELAPKFGVNHIEFSHDLIMDIDEAVARGPALDELAQLADERGIETYVWAHEFNDIGGFSACFNPGHENSTLRNRQDQYRKGLARMPHVDGVVLMYGSSDVAPWRVACTCPQCAQEFGIDDPMKDPSPEERCRRVAEAVDDVVAGEFGKRTILRTFDHSPEEHEIILGGLRLTRPQVMAMSKDVPQDWEPYYPDDPAFGTVGPRRHLAELDLAGEYWGQSEIPFCAVDYLKRRITYERGQGACGVAGRISRGSQHALGTPNEVNLYAASLFASDPLATSQQVWDRFMRERYGLTPGDPSQARLVAILRSTFDVGRKMYYPKGFWALEKGSDVPKDGAAPRLLKGRSISLWDPDYQSWFEELCRPTEQTLVELWQEKVEARDIAERNLASFEEVASSLRPEDREDLRRRLAQQRLAVDIWAHVTDAVFRTQLAASTRDKRHAGIIAWDLQRLEELGLRMEKEFGPNVSVGSPNRIRSFILSVASFAQDASPEPLRQMELTEIRAEGLTPTSALIRWVSSRSATSQVETGTEIPDYGGKTLESSKRTQAHEVRLTGLAPKTRYAFRVLSRDRKGQLIVSGDFWLEAP